MIRILVCIKEISTYSEHEGAGKRNIPLTGYRMNMYDEYALEEAVRIKEANPGTLVDAFSLGSERVAATLKNALERGADRAFRYDYNEGSDMTPFQKASIISAFASQGDYNLILTGIMSEDFMHGEVGPMTAALMKIPCAVSVVREEMNERESLIEVESEIEGGSKVLYRLTLPALLAIQTGINTPRYPSLSNKLRAKKQDIVTVDSSGRVVMTPCEKINSLFYPEKIIMGTHIEGTRVEKAEILLNMLHEKAFI